MNSSELPPQQPKLDIEEIRDQLSAIIKKGEDAINFPILEIYRDLRSAEDDLSRATDSKKITTDGQKVAKMAHMLSPKTLDRLNQLLRVYSANDVRKIVSSVEADLLGDEENLKADFTEEAVESNEEINRKILEGVPPSMRTEAGYQEVMALLRKLDKLEEIEDAQKSAEKEASITAEEKTKAQKIRMRKAPSRLAYNRAPLEDALKEAELEYMKAVKRYGSKKEHTTDDKDDLNLAKDRYVKYLQSYIESIEKFKQEKEEHADRAIGIEIQKRYEKAVGEGSGKLIKRVGLAYLDIAKEVYENTEAIYLKDKNRNNKLNYEAAKRAYEKALAEHSKILSSNTRETSESQPEKKRREIETETKKRNTSAPITKPQPEKKGFFRNFFDNLFKRP